MDQESFGRMTANFTPARQRILPLSADAISQIHSSTQITSLHGVVLALLENSLDANATKIDISVNFARGSCTVEDNGDGIPLSEFHDDGGLGKMYHTSKTSLNGSRDVHGSTGTYLASLSALSLMSVTSRHRDEIDSGTLSMHQAKVIARHTPTRPSHELSHFGTSGTRVTVNDLFGNMPVRVKHRALSGHGTGSADDKTWQELKHGIAALLLAWRSPCSVKIRDAEAQGRILTLSGSHPTVSAALTEKSLNQLLGRPARYDLRDALPVIFQAGLASFDTRTRWVPLSASTIKLSVRGTICLDPAPTKACQFVSLGLHPVSAANGHSDIYDSINRIFANSSFGFVEDEPAPIDETEKDRRKHDRRYKADGYTQKQIRGSKGIDRWPMLVLQIQLKNPSRSGGTADSMSDHQLKAVIEILEVMVTQWLTAHNFRPRTKRKRKNEQQHSPANATSPASSRSWSGARSRGSASLAPRTAMALESTKKRRVVDLSGNDIDLERAPEHIRPNTLDSWSRIKGGKRSDIHDVWSSRKIATAPTSLPRLHANSRPEKHTSLVAPSLDKGAIHNAENSALLGGPGKELGENYHDNQTVSSYGDLLNAEGVAAEATEGVEDLLMNWTDPVTGQKFRVNSRTGIVLPSGQYRPSTSECTPRRASAAINTATTSAGRPLTLARRSITTPQSNGPSQLPQVLREWRNPVFARQTEECIPVASLAGPGVELAELAARRCSHHDEAQHFSNAGICGHGSISKAALREARVIKQVDAKFILCSIPIENSDSESEGQTLVLVDQHAASERVLLEQLLAELCSPVGASSPAAQLKTNMGHSATVQTIILAKPLHFDVSPQEYDLLRLHAAYFAGWGILYDIQNEPAMEASSSQVRSTRPRYQLSVRALPPGIAERCTLVPKLIIDLLRSEVWALAQSGRRRQQIPLIAELNDADEHAWLRHMGSCPNALLDLLNSRACRSAVMFNDVLSVGECEDLLRALAKCAFPFMCAHGRVSMVPLVSLGKGEGFRVGDGKMSDFLGREEKGKGFGEAFKAWKSKG